ncbi:serine/threonine-protein kinase PDIK1L-like [Haliotis rubra]|uniref:serine/threonine-protein kinase PDIK1L-like n=1 Tax=Haliotis rubra TaxID=36100 RepID=UPI001EE4FED9|nr:serine/threonine-protein kinase PDIK1L-like [Haliotis rubra]
MGLARDPQLIARQLNMYPDRIGDYKILSTLGTGAFGDVYKVEKGGKEYAMKDIVIGAKVDNMILQMEVDSHKSIPKHDNIVVFIDSFQTKYNWYIVLEYCALGTLEDYVIAHRPDKDVATSLMLDMAKGLHHLHSNNIVHRDIKPENILMVKGPYGIPRCKISDFGVARFGIAGSDPGPSNGVGQEELYFQSLCGTPYFIAPEVKNRQYTRSCDVFSLGIVFYLLFSKETSSDNRLTPWAKGGTPFYRATDAQIKDQLKKHIHDVTMYKLIESMLVIDFHNRVTAKDLVDNLMALEVPDDEVFLAAWMFVAVVIMLAIFPFPLFVLTVIILLLACWQLLPRSTIRKVSLLT